MPCFDQRSNICCPASVPIHVPLVCIHIDYKLKIGTFIDIIYDFVKNIFYEFFVVKMLFFLHGLKKHIVETKVEGTFWTIIDKLKIYVYVCDKPSIFISELRHF